MPGGKGNIKPEDGKQFSSDYQPAEKWTEKRALEVGNELIVWLTDKENPENIFFEDFLYLENNYYHELITYLCNKFTSFLKLIEQARKIQEIKLKKFGCFDKLNAAMTKFTLINNHDWKDRKDLTSDDKEINTIDFSKYTFEELKELANKKDD